MHYICKFEVDITCILNNTRKGNLNFIYFTFSHIFSTTLSQLNVFIEPIFAKGANNSEADCMCSELNRGWSDFLAFWPLAVDRIAFVQSLQNTN